MNMEKIQIRNPEHWDYTELPPNTTAMTGRRELIILGHCTVPCGHNLRDARCNLCRATRLPKQEGLITNATNMENQNQLKKSLRDY